MAFLCPPAAVWNTASVVQKSQPESALLLRYLSLIYHVSYT